MIRIETRRRENGEGTVEKKKLDRQLTDAHNNASVRTSTSTKTYG